MTSAELSAAAPGSRRQGLRALDAQRLINLFALRLAPAVAAGLIALSHMRDPGEALIVFASVLLVAQLIERSELPLHLMPASRVMLAVAAPVAGTVLAAAIFLAAGDPYPISHYTAIALGALLVLALGAWVRVRVTEKMRARVAVIGSRNFASDFAAELDAARVPGYEVVGWIGDGPTTHPNLQWLGDLETVREAVSAECIDLLVCAPSTSDDSAAGVEDLCANVAETCLDLPVRLIAANQLYEEVLGHVPVGMIDAAWYRYIMHPRFRASAPFSKRIFDLFFGLLIALVFLPVIVIAVIAIKLTDGGPILYRQRRLGEYGESFEILKLRTMTVDAEADGPRWAEAGDGRVTRVGRFLRRTHLDETPQLINILRGEMTLVGPRPERPEMVAELERRFPHYTRRHLVKPGIAGWAALRCGYSGSEIGTAWKLCHDLFYIKQRSLLADTLILAETSVEVFRNAHRVLRAPGDRFLLGEESHG